MLQVKGSTARLSFRILGKYAICGRLVVLKSSCKTDIDIRFFHRKSKGLVYKNETTCLIMGLKMLLNLIFSGLIVMHPRTFFPVLCLDVILSLQVRLQWNHLHKV